MYEQRMKIILKLIAAPLLFSISCSAYSGIETCESDIGKARERLTKARTADEYGRPTHDLKDIRDIEDSIHSLLKKCGENVSILLLLVDTNLMQGKNSEAIANAKRALAIEPNNPMTNQYYSMALSTGSNIEEIHKYQRKASELAPNNSPIQLNYCSVLEASGQHKEAIAICTKYIESDAKNIAPAIYIRGRAYKALGMTKEANSDFAQAKSKGFSGTPYYSKEHYGK